MDGQAQQLPRLGQLSWENTLAAYGDSDKTVTIGNDDSAAGQLFVYTGSKQKTGSAFDKAGLTNGVNRVLDLENEAVSTDAQFRAVYGKGKAVKFTLGSDEAVDWDSSGARQNADAASKGLTLNRIEDGVFDPKHPNDYYMLTTEGAPGVVPSEPAVTRDGGGLWRVRFKDVDRPEKGGTIELLLDGSEAPYGIIDAEQVLGKGWFLFDAQAHKAFPDAAKVEYGQLLALHVPKFKDVYTIDG